MIKVIRNAKIITMENDSVINGEIVIKDNIINDIVDKYNGEFDEEIDALGNIVMPGLINCHTHLGMYNFRNTNDNLKLMDWLNNKIWPIESEMTDKDISDASYNSCIEMISSGTTSCADFYYGDATESIKKSGIRCLYTRCLMDSDNNGETRFNEFKNLYEREKDKSDLITYSMSFHSFYTCTMDYIKECKKYADEINLIVNIHYMENEDEHNSVDSKSIDVLLDNKLIMAHGVYIDDYSKFKNKDVSIAYNPISNLSLGCGFADIIKMKENNINVCIGTDGVGSGYTLNLFKHLNFAYLLSKGIYKDPSVISAYEVLKMATVNGAKALGIDKLGMIKKGYKADIIIAELKDKPVNNEFVALLTNNVEVKCTIINGNVLYKN